MTPPREPVQSIISFISPAWTANIFDFGGRGNHTGSSQNAGNSDELDGLLSGIHFCDLEVLGLVWWFFRK